MAFRDLILAASSQPAGSTLRVHMNNLNAGGLGTTYNIEGFDIEIEDINYELSITDNTYIIDIDTSDILVEIEEE